MQYPTYGQQPYPQQPYGQQPYGQQQAQRPDRTHPEWAHELTTLYRARIARQFVLHFNINDFTLDLAIPDSHMASQQPDIADVAPGTPDQPPTFREYLHDLLYNEFGCQAIYTYTLASGLLADDRERRGIGQPLNNEMRGRPVFTRVIDAMKATGTGTTGAQASRQPQGQQAQQMQGVEPGQRSEGREVDLPQRIPDNLKILGHLLRQPYIRQGPDGAPITSTDGTPIEEPVAVILDYAEKLVPYHLGEGQGTIDQLRALEVIQSWALDPMIRRTNNLIVLLTTNKEHISAVISAEGSGCREIRVHLPDTKERSAFIRHKARLANPRLRLARLDASFNPSPNATEEYLQRALTRATQGMRLMDIDSVNRKAVMQSRQRGLAPGQEILTAVDVQDEKKATIQSQSADLLEIVPPVRGFGEIGGLNELKAYLTKRSELMRDGRHSPLIPSGLLLAGPPGTGKTIIAEALATESGFNLVKMRNIQDRWVGSSERNLDMVLHLLQDLNPVIVFVDEIDQAMGRRDTGQGGDSGVSARMFARILEEMSKAENRGRILWVAATNRTDILDDALLRRFDRVVPLLAPDAEESRLIFATMPRMISKQSGNHLNITFGGDLTLAGNAIAGRPDLTKEDLAKFQSVAERSAAMGLTGAEIEIVMRRAVEYASEEVLEHNQTLDDRNMPPINSSHLLKAMADFKINHDADMYDLQSLLAIRSCNFYSMLPKQLPKRPIFAHIYGSDGRIDPGRLDNAIQFLWQRVRTRASGGGGGGGDNGGSAGAPA
ncbi:MAG TPA: ATP-binding protein [Ktedonobacterales bacterium]|nr:ATP-binding protein [Ktedonobacterales bacterium]